MPTIVHQSPTPQPESISEFTIFLDDIMAFGLDQSIMLHVIGTSELPQYSLELSWIDGVRWTKIPLLRFQKLCPFWNRTKIQRLLTDLESRGQIESTTSPNSHPSIRTKWYRSVINDDGFGEWWDNEGRFTSTLAHYQVLEGE